MTPTFIAQLAATGALAPTPDNAQAFQMTWTGRQLEVGYAERHSATNVFNAHSHATLLGIGALAYNLDAALAANGVSGQWTWTADVAAVWQPGAAPAFPPPSRRRAGRPSAIRTATRSSAMRCRARWWRAWAPSAKAITGSRCSRERAGRRWCGWSDWPRKRAFATKRCTTGCSAACAIRRPQVAAGDGLDMNSLGLPPGGRALMNFISDWPRMRALNRIGAYKLLARSEVGLLSAPRRPCCA